MQKPNVDECKQAMGFQTNTTTVLDILEKAHRFILGQVMDINYLIWNFLFGHEKINMVCQITLTHPPTFFLDRLHLPLKPSCGCRGGAML